MRAKEKSKNGIYHIMLSDGRTTAIENLKNSTKQKTMIGLG
ncbi:MAG TPA: hypothetical protein VF941_12615 [Clostridia bacterium]